MHLIITDAWMAKSRAIYLSGPKLVLAIFFAGVVLMLLTAGLYNFIFIKGAREGWPILGPFCGGQVISDSLIGFFDVDSRSKALGDKLPSFECSLRLL